MNTLNPSKRAVQTRLTNLRAVYRMQTQRAQEAHEELTRVRARLAEAEDELLQHWSNPYRDA